VSNCRQSFSKKEKGVNQSLVQTEVKDSLSWSNPNGSSGVFLLDKKLWQMWQAERRGTEGMGMGTATVHEQTWKKSTILHADSLFGNHDMVQRPAIRRAELRQPPRFLPSWPVLDTERTKTGDKIEFLSNFKTAPCFQ
jgi:hypothetical protein